MTEEIKYPKLIDITELESWEAFFKINQEFNSAILKEKAKKSKELQIKITEFRTWYFSTYQALTAKIPRDDLSFMQERNSVLKQRFDEIIGETEHLITNVREFSEQYNRLADNCKVAVGTEALLANLTVILCYENDRILALLIQALENK